MSDLRERLRVAALSSAAWLLMKLIGHTTRFHVDGYEHVTKLREAGQGFILAVWHGRTMLPIFHCRGMGIWAIVSISRDGEVQKSIIGRFGYKSIRGSTGRNAVRAALAAIKELQAGGILSITPDGPRGPVHEVQEGVIFMAKRAQCPVIPIGVGIRHRKLISSWDSYTVPRPFGKCVLIFGEPILFHTDEHPDPERFLKEALNSVEGQAKLKAGEE